MVDGMNSKRQRIGVRNFTTQHNMSDTINDVSDFDLGAFSDAEAREFVNQLTASVGIKISVDATNYLLRKIGWNIPFFIQLIVSRLPVGKVSKANIDEAYNKLLQTGSFDTWYERLSKEYGRNKDIAKLVLKYLCVCTDGKKRDGYLVKDREQYRFRSPLLRDYWKETYC